MKFTQKRVIDREAVRKSLRELELLFGKKQTYTKENPQRAAGEMCNTVSHKEVSQ